jgi:hypothetical protein
MPKVEFIAVNQTGQPTDRRILAFLWPQAVPDSAVFHAWQLLSPPLGGGQARFEHGGPLTVCAGEPASRSALVEAAPGSLFAVRSRNGQGPHLVLVDQNGSGGAAGVENATGAPLGVTWYCGGRPLMEQRNLLPRERAGLELRPDLLLFSVAVPSSTGRYSAEEVAGASYRYVIPRQPAAPKTVRIVWRRDVAGNFVLEFHPPSAEPSPPASADAPPPAAAKELAPEKVSKRKTGERK